MLARGAGWFAKAAAKAGVDGVICVDIPAEEDDALGVDLRAAGIDLVRLATPTTDAARLPAVLEGASGFLAGRGVWRNAIGKGDERKALVEDALPRLQRLCDVVDEAVG